MEYLQIDAVTPRSLLLLGLVLVAGFFLFRATKHLIFAVLSTIVAVAIVAWAMDILTVDKAKAAASAVRDKADQMTGRASDTAKKIGNQGYSTSAGEGGQTNEHYEKHVENK